MLQTVITDDNIRSLVKAYLTNKQSLPEDLKTKLIREWDVRNVTDMSSLFAGTKFDEHISGWDVSNVTNMAEMFSDCKVFGNNDGYIGDWYVNNVTNMSDMFNGCVKFNRDLSRWNVQKVTDAKGMFRGCNIDAQKKPYFNSNIMATTAGGSLKSKRGRTARKRRQKRPGKRTTIRK